MTRTTLRLGHLWLPAIIAVSYMAAASPSFSVSMEVSATGTARFLGTFDGSILATGVVYATENVSDDIELRLTFATARVRIVNSPYIVHDSAVGPRFTSPLNAETLEDSDLSGEIQLLSVSAKGSYRILPLLLNDELELIAEGPRTTSLAPVEDWTGLASPGSAVLPADASRPTLVPMDAGRLTFADGAPIATQGKTLAYLYGGSFVVSQTDGRSRVVETGERLNTTRSFSDPGGTSGVWWFDRIVLLIEGENVASEIAGADITRAIIGARNLAGTWKGDLTLAGVSGDIRVNGAPAEPTAQLVQAIGNLTGSADYAESAGVWSVTGPATFFGVNGATVQGDRDAHRTATLGIIAGSAAAFALAGALASHWGRELLTFISGRNVVAPLDSKVRRGMLEQIGQQPGTTLSQLAARFGMSSWGARYHIAVLKRAQLVDEVRDGNVDTYMLNGHSFRFQVPSTSADGPRVEAAAAMAILHHPIRRLIHDALVERGYGHYAQLVETWRAKGVPDPLPTPQEVTYHGSKMEDTGLVTRSRAGRHVIWSLNVDSAFVRNHQKRAFAQHSNLQRLYATLRLRPSWTMEEIREALRNERPRWTRKSLREALFQLRVAGIVAEDEASAAISLKA